MAISWRDRFKAGPFGSLYGMVRRAKRTIRREPIAGTPPMLQAPLPADTLRAAAREMPDHGRLYFSLALAELFGDAASDAPNLAQEAGSRTSLRRALACLRTAEFFDFEAAERVLLYKAWIYARLGDTAMAQRLTADIEAWELDEERPLLERIRAGAVSALRDSTPSVALRALELYQDGHPSMKLLVAGDATAESALWLPHSRYLLIDESVTGLTIEIAERLAMRFAVGIADTRIADAARRLECDRWIERPYVPIH